MKRAGQQWFGKSFLGPGALFSKGRRLRQIFIVIPIEQCKKRAGLSTEIVKLV